MAIKVFINGVKVPVLSGVKVKRTASDLTVCTASFTTPLDYITDAQEHAVVHIYSNGVTYFIGTITSYSLQYSGKALSLSMECTDATYTLSHSLLPLTATDVATISTMSGRLTFTNDPRVKTGVVIESLLTKCSILHSLTDDASDVHEYVGLRTIDLPDSCLVFDPGTMLSEVIESICKATGAIFFLKFVGMLTVGVFDTYTNLIENTDITEFNTEVAVSDSTHLVLSFNLNSVPESVCTRVTEEILDIAISDDYTFADTAARDAYFVTNPTELVAGISTQCGTAIYEYSGTDWVIVVTHYEAATSGSYAPYIDKYIKIASTSGTDITTDPANKLANYAACIESASISIVGSALQIYNKVALSGLYTDMGISSAISDWRITDLTLTMSSGGIISDATLVDIGMISIQSKLAGAYDSYDIISAVTDKSISDNNPQVAVVISVNSDDGTITVRYGGVSGSEETLKDYSI